MKLQENKDSRGSLRVLDQLPFDDRRVYFIDGMSADRGGHRHQKTRQIMICSRGSVDVFMDNGSESKTFHLNGPNLALLIEPTDWHSMKNASADALITVLASEFYSKEDYINEPY